MKKHPDADIIYVAPKTLNQVIQAVAEVEDIGPGDAIEMIDWYLSALESTGRFKFIFIGSDFTLPSECEGVEGKYGIWPMASNPGLIVHSIPEGMAAEDNYE